MFNKKFGSDWRKSEEGFWEDFEKKLTELVQQQPDLAGNIQRLEEDYDNDIFDNEMSEIKEWLEQQGIRLD